MAASGKKCKKHKGKTIPLTDFLADGTSGPGPGPGKVIARCSRAWADEVEAEDDGHYSSSRSKQPVVLPTAPREARSARSVDEENLPRSPPFKAYIVNLHYDTTERDVLDLFAGASVLDVQLPRDDRAGRLKGFGYIEFETRGDLAAALAMDDACIRGRRMRIEVSVNNDAGGGGGERRGGGGGRYDPERTQGDWRSGPRVEVPARNTTEVADQGALTRERGSFSRDNMDQRPRDFRAVAGNRGRYHDNNNNSSRFRGKNYSDAYEERGRHFGNRGGYFGEDRPRPQSSNEPETPAEPKTRPKLCLAQRTVAGTEDGAVSVQSAIFGGARPVDTAAREKEVEESRMMQSEGRGSESREVECDEKDGTEVVRSSIFGGATPVDTSGREREVEARHARSAREAGAVVMRHLQKPPARSTIFGGATPVDTAAREREVEARLADTSAHHEWRPARDKKADARTRAVAKEDCDHQQVDNKFEVAQPPVENVWLRRAAQQAANQERGQMFAPPMAFKNTHGL